MQEYLVVQTLDKLGIDYDSAGSTLEAAMYKKYGPECSKRVLVTMRDTIQCVKRQLKLGRMEAAGGAPGLQALQAGNPAAFVCRLVDLAGVERCAERLQDSGKLACTHDNLVSNEARTIAAAARAAQHLCRDQGEMFGRGLLQLQTCEAERFQLYRSGIADCTGHFQRLMQEQEVSLPGSPLRPESPMLTESLEAVQNVSLSCPALVRLAQCVPPALGHCSNLLEEVSTDALREVVFQGLCVDAMGESAVLQAMDEFGRKNYFRAEGSGAGAVVGGVRTVLLAVAASLLWAF